MPSHSMADPAALDDLLLYRLSRLLSTASTMVIRLCEGRFGITRREWRVIALLARQGDLLSSELAVHAQLDRARISRAITSLVGKRLVDRQVRVGDRRQVALALTPEGHALHAQLFPQVREINLRLLEALPDGGTGELQQLLGALQARADTMVAQAHLPKADRRRGGRARLPVA